MSGAVDASKHTRILILGGGFGGVAAARMLESKLRHRDDVEITLVARENYSLFTPMLHAVAAGETQPASIANPLRTLVPRVTTFEATVESIDLSDRCVEVSHPAQSKNRQLAYDLLLLAVGSESNFLHVPGVAERANTLKSLGDAVLLRNRILGVLEAASVEDDEARRKALLTFVVGGGGFAGVETMGAITDLVNESLPHYPRLENQKPKFILVHGGPVLLPELGESLGSFTQRRLQDRGVEVRLKTRVTGQTATQVQCDDGKPIDAITLVWTTGTAPSRLFKTIEAKVEEGRIVVNDKCEVADQPGVWAVGDCAAVPDPASPGKPCPQTAQHAIRQGALAGSNIAATILGKPAKPFAFKTLGQLASIGGGVGVARILGVNLSGVTAFLLWRAVYLWKLPRLPKKLHVLGAWITGAIAGRDLVQLVSLHDLDRMAKLADQVKRDRSAR